MKTNHAKDIPGKKLITVVLPALLSLSLAAGCTSADGAAGTASVSGGTTETVSGSAASGSDTQYVSSVSTEYDSDDEDIGWDAAKASTIVLNGNSITADGSGVKADGSTATITAAGTYVISGTLTEGPSSRLHRILPQSFFRKRR